MRVHEASLGRSLTAVAVLAVAAGALAAVVDLPTAVVAATWGAGALAAAGAVARRTARGPAVTMVDQPEEAPPDGDATAPSRSVRRRTVVLGGAAVVGGGAAVVATTEAPADAAPWRAGLHLVTEDGRMLRPPDVPPGGMVNAWPEGAIGHEEGPVLLLRLAGPPQPPTVLDWVVDETLVAYSKVCTHAGCAVALFRTGSDELYCPCHQAMFAADRGARPTFGPATRALPQLPMAVDAQGFLIAAGGFRAEVGPRHG